MGTFMNCGTVRLVKNGFGCLCLIMAATIGLSAQSVSVSIQGRVYDTTGAAISQASVSAVNSATGFSRTAVASATGDYQIPSLPPGDYTIAFVHEKLGEQDQKVTVAAKETKTVDQSFKAGGE